MVGSHVPVPDGGSLKTITVEHRSILTLKPAADGTFGLAIVSNPIGAIALSYGTADFTSWQINADGNHSATSQYYPSVIVGGATSGTFDKNGPSDFRASYSVIPFSEWIMDGSRWPPSASVGLGSFYGAESILDGPVNQNGFRISKWRTVTTTARLRYCGNALNNGGVMAIARSPVAIGSRFDLKLAGVTESGSTTMLLRDAVLGQASGGIPESFDRTAALPGAKIVPVMLGADVICPPTDFDWHEWEDAFFVGYNTAQPETHSVASPTTNLSLYDMNMAVALRARNAGLPVEEIPDNTATIGDGLAFATAAWENTAYGGTPDVLQCSAAPLPGWSNNDVTFIHAQGCDPAQPTIVEVRTCCEYTLAFNSPCARFARDSPKPRPGAIKRVMDIARRLPAAKPPSDDYSWIEASFNAVKDVMAGPLGKIARGVAKMAISSFAPPLAPLAVGW